MRGMGIGIAVLLALTLTGCIRWQPKMDLERYDIAEYGKAPDPFGASNPAEAMVKVRGVRAILSEAERSRRDDQFYSSETGFYGTLLSAIGVGVDSVAIRNTGAGAAALSSIITGRYQLPVQRAAIRKALDRAECIESKLLAVQNIGSSVAALRTQAQAFSITPDPAMTDDQRQRASQDMYFAAARLDAASSGVAQVTTEALHDLADALDKELDSVQLTTLTRAQMSGIFEQARAEEEEAKNNPPKGLLSAYAAEITAADTYQSQVNTCFVP